MEKQQELKTEDVNLADILKKQLGEEKAKLNSRVIKYQNLRFNEAATYLLSSWKIYLPEWKGYWIGVKDSTGNVTIVAYTRDKVYATTPHVKYMLRNDWIAEPLTNEEYDLHKNFKF